nr:AraC family transcriptional regulator [Bacteroidales bacterium]
TEWIDKCVILDAEAQLLSSKRTILEISESLGFSSQSFFGKYFKRVKGFSPKEYRAKN